MATGGEDVTRDGFFVNPPPPVPPHEGRARFFPADVDVGVVGLREKTLPPSPGSCPPELSKRSLASISLPEHKFEHWTTGLGYLALCFGSHEGFSTTNRHSWQVQCRPLQVSPKLHYIPKQVNPSVYQIHIMDGNYCSPTHSARLSLDCVVGPLVCIGWKPLEDGF